MTFDLMLYGLAGINVQRNTEVFYRILSRLSPTFISYRFSVYKLDVSQAILFNVLRYNTRSTH